MRRNKNRKGLLHAGSLEKRQAILTALTRATGDGYSLDLPDGQPDDDMGSYYTLTLEETAALVNGDMDGIENWVSHLDRRHATWLLRCLIKERR